MTQTLTTVTFPGDLLVSLSKQNVECASIQTGDSFHIAVEEIDISFDCKDAKQELFGPNAVQKADKAVGHVLSLKGTKSNLKKTY